MNYNGSFGFQNSNITIMNKTFYQLIRIALGTQDALDRLPSEAEWDELFAMAKKQSLVGITFIAIQKMGADADEGYARIGISEETYFTWVGVAAKIQVTNELVNRQCAVVQQRLFADGFRSFIMKGQANAALYSDLSAYRQSGDIDVYVEGGFHKVNAYVQKLSPTKKVNRLEIQLNAFEDTEVEIHYKPFYMPSPIDDRKLQQFFSKELESCFSNKITLANSENAPIQISAPTAAFNIVHQLVHIWHHFFTEGVGMRQLMDYYFVLRARKDEGTSTSLNIKLGMRDEGINHTISSLGLTRFTQGLMHIMHTVFGLPQEYLLCEPDAVWGERILKEVMHKGNFGKDSEDNLLSLSKRDRFFEKARFAWRYRALGNSPWLWIPLRSIADRIWMKRYGFQM